MRPTDLPHDMAVAMAQEKARRNDRALRALRLLENTAATGLVPDDRAVSHAARVLMDKPAPYAVARSAPRVLFRQDGHTEWLELPGVAAVEWRR